MIDDNRSSLRCNNDDDDAHFPSFQVFFVLRKKQNQVSFLHVYHHTGMVLLTWHGVKYLPGGHSVFMGALNSFVHVVMYCYYLITALNPKYKNNLWWKKYITQLQIVRNILLGEIKRENLT